MSDKEKALVKACSEGNLQQVQQLITNGANAHEQVLMRDSSRVSEYDHPLHAAIRSKSEPLIRYMLDTVGVDPMKARSEYLYDGRRSTFVEQYDALCYAIKSGCDIVFVENFIRKVAGKGELNARVAKYISECGLSSYDEKEMTEAEIKEFYKQ